MNLKEKYKNIFGTLIKLKYLLKLLSQDAPLDSNQLFPLLGYPHFLPIPTNHHFHLIIRAQN